MDYQYFIFLFNKLWSIFYRGSALNDKPRVRPLVVSMTTYNKRLNKVFLAIKSLLSQSVKPDAILLWLSSEDLDDMGLPNNLLALQKMGLQIRIVSENIRSYKKLIYTLKEYETADVITCDDDVLYPYRFIEGLWKTSKEFPGTIVGYRCSYMRKAASGLAPYLDWQRATVRGPSYNLFPTGVGGILYPPKSLNDEVLDNKVFMDMVPTADDIWFKFMGLKNNTLTVMVNSESTEFSLIPGTQDDALWRINTRKENNLNDVQIRKLLDRYDVINLLE
jgi:Glycosyl transferase family 64 domain